MNEVRALWILLAIVGLGQMAQIGTTVALDDRVANLETCMPVPRGKHERWIWRMGP